jgi:hypothetical protein
MPKEQFPQTQLATSTGANKIASKDAIAVSRPTFSEELKCLSGVYDSEREYRSGTSTSTLTYTTYDKMDHGFIRSTIKQELEIPPYSLVEVGSALSKHYDLYSIRIIPGRFLPVPDACSRPATD